LEWIRHRSQLEEEAIRAILKWTAPVERRNEAIKDGSLIRTLELLIEELKPQSAHFAIGNGKRGGQSVLNTTNPSEIQQMAKTISLNLEAEVEFQPAMNADDCR